VSETKVCTICKEEKPILSFLKIKGKRAGRCKPCRTEYNKARKAYRDNWYKENRERLIVLNKQYVEENRERITAYKAQWYLENKERMNEKSKQHYQNSDRDLLRDRELQKNYGISLAQRNQLLEEQGGGCAICGATEDLTGKELAVDHCHRTEIVRGILCSLCNTGIGMLGDDSQSVEKDLKYLIEAEDRINQLIERVDLTKTKEINDTED